MADGRLISVNVSRQERPIVINGRSRLTGIFKEPVDGALEVAEHGFVDDRIVDRRYHGGINRAVYAYGTGDYEWWANELERETGPGLFGENLTVSGIDPSHAVIGERWRIGSALFEVSEPREPCTKLAAKMEDRGFVRTFAKALRFGAYMRVIEGGTVAAGEEVEVVDRPAHGITTEILGRVMVGQHQFAAQALEAEPLPDDWREFLEKKAAA